MAALFRRTDSVCRGDRVAIEGNEIRARAVAAAENAANVGDASDAGDGLHGESARRRPGGIACPAGDLIGGLLGGLLGNQGAAVPGRRRCLISIATAILWTKSFRWPVT